jgi:hypothetical protein
MAQVFLGNMEKIPKFPKAAQTFFAYLGKTRQYEHNVNIGLNSTPSNYLIYPPLCVNGTRVSLLLIFESI